MLNSAVQNTAESGKLYLSDIFICRMLCGTLSFDFFDQPTLSC